MSSDQLAAFFKRLVQDPELRAAFTAFAAQHGFTLSADQLAEADLDVIAGGIDTVPLPESRALRFRSVIMPRDVTR